MPRLSCLFKNAHVYRNTICSNNMSWVIRIHLYSIIYYNSGENERLFVLEGEPGGYTTATKDVMPYSNVYILR